MRKDQVVRYVVLSQLIFVVTLVVCSIIEPHVLFSNQPISMFGNLAHTVVLFMAGLLAVSLTFFKASRLLPKTGEVNRVLSKLFLALAIVICGLSVTPFTVNPFFYVAHVTFATGFYLTELSAGMWLVRHTSRNILNYSLYCLQAGGVIMAILSTSEIGTFHLLATAQLLVIVSFSILLIRTVKQIEET